MRNQEESRIVDDNVGIGVEAQRWVSRMLSALPLVADAELRKCVDGDADPATWMTSLSSYLTRSYPERSLGELFPTLVVIDAQVNWTEASTRLSNVLARQGQPSWRSLAPKSIEVLTSSAGWQNFGVTSARELIGRAVQLVDQHGSGGGLAPVELGRMGRGSGGEQDPPDPVRTAVELITSWGYCEQSAETFGSALECVESLPSNQIPESVRVAYMGLYGLDAESIGGRFHEDFDLERSLEDLVDVVDGRTWSILVGREFRLDRTERPTLSELARKHGLSSERVRQLERSGVEAVERFLGTARGGPVSRAAAAIRDAVGKAAPASTAMPIINDLLAVRGLNERISQDFRDIILWCAGPFVSDGDFIALREGDVGAALSTLLRERVEHSSLSMDEAIDVVQRFGIGTSDPGVARAWIHSSQEFRVLDGQLVWWGGPLGDKAASVLRVVGQPITKRVLHELIGEGSEGTINNIIQSDARFIRLDRDLYGLSDWGGEEYVGIVSLIARELDHEGGVISLDELVERLTAAFSVAASSIRSYAANHPSFTTVSGTVRRREDTGAGGAVKQISDEPDCYRKGRRWLWRRAVDYDLLRGSGSVLPTGVATYLGLEPGEKTSVSSLHGQVTLSWKGLQPTIGSLRLAAESLGAVEGDWLFVVLDDEHELRFELMSREAFEGAAPLKKVALLMGIDQGEFAQDELGTLGRALGLEMAGHLGEVEAVLRVRGDDELVALLPDRSSPEVGLDDVLRHLGFQ